MALKLQPLPHHAGGGTGGYSVGSVISNPSPPTCQPLTMQRWTRIALQ